MYNVSEQIEAAISEVKDSSKVSHGKGHWEWNLDQMYFCFILEGSIGLPGDNVEFTGGRGRLPAPSTIKLKMTPAVENINSYYANC